MEFKVLAAGVEEERREWLRLWSLLPRERRDAYFLAGYLQACEAVGQGRAYCAVAEQGEALLLYPFLKNPIGHAPTEIGGGAGAPHGAGAGRSDVLSPYGYGGPVVTEAAESGGFLTEAWARWGRWCAENGVVGEFIRFHPLLDNRRWAPPEARCFVDRPTVPLRLDTYPKAIWDDAYFRRHRHMVRKAEREECRFEVLPVLDQLDWFVPLYAETQERLQAKDDTRLPSAYFETLARELGERAWLGTVRKEGQIVAAVFVLDGDAFSHCHLMGDRRAGGNSGITNLVYHGIALEAARRGQRVLHMGGGRSADEADSLLKFKTSLSPERASFWLGTRCHDAAAYARLGAQWEAQNGPPPPGYFLYYRLPGKPLHEKT